MRAKRYEGFWQNVLVAVATFVERKDREYQNTTDLYPFVMINIALNAFRHIILRNLSDDGSRY